MANFDDQVMGLTGLTISGSSTAPSQTELSTFLNDGVIDVTNRWLLVKPQDVENFTRESAEQTSNGFNPGTSEIVSVIRESGTDGQWYPCNKKHINLQYLVTDVESLHYASKYNPVYMITQNRNLHVFPAPSAAGNNGFKVLYVNSSPEETDGTALVHSSSGIKWFPEDKVYLVILYASMRSLQAKMADTTISDLSITAVPPDTPPAPSFTAAGVSTVTVRAISASAPTYDTSVATSALAEANNFIDNDEDVELANAKLAEVQALIQDELNDFNQQNIVYQQDVQEALGEFQATAAEAQKEGDFEQQTQIQEYASKIQRYQNEIAAYQADVAVQVQEYTQNLQADGVGYQWLQGQYATLKAEYDAAFILAAPKPQPQAQERR